MRKAPLVFAAVAAVALGASAPLTVIDSVTSLLARPATHGETLLVLGYDTAFDGHVSIAQHYKTLVHPIDYINYFPATNIGEWYIVDIAAGSTTISTVTNQAVMCSDGTSHYVSVRLDPVTLAYTLQVDQANAGVAPRGTVLTCPDDLTAHVLSITKYGTNYLLSVDQSLSAASPLYTLVFFAPDDSTLHTLSVLKYGTNYLTALSQ